MADLLKQLLKKYPPDIRELVQEMRMVLLKDIPKEKVYLGWSTIYYSFTDRTKDLVIAIGLMPNRLNLYFRRGTDLNDPNELLEGTGKNMRHVKIFESKQIRSRAVNALIKQAIALAKSDQKQKSS
jgi:hypothetical protein